MDTISRINKQLAILFAKQPCWMIEPLATELKYSIPSVRRFLAAAEYYSSFTHNGKWYTLRSIPSFNRDGLWFHQEIGFSSAGSLTQTLINIIANSPEGVTAEQLGKKLNCRCHTMLVQLHRIKKILRQKNGRSFVYLSADLRIAERQRQTISLKNIQVQQLPAEIALFILVEFIRNPEAAFTQLAKTIKRSRKITVNVSEIEGVFQQYGLKKTMLTGVPRHGEH